MGIGHKIKTGLRHPKRALAYPACGEKRYCLIQAESMGRSMKPMSNLERHMILPTDIHEHLAILNMLKVELNLKTVVELGTGTGESAIASLEAAKRMGGESAV